MGLIESQGSKIENVELSVLAFLDENAGYIADRYLYEFAKIALSYNGYEAVDIVQLKKDIFNNVAIEYSCEEIELAIEKCDKQEKEIKRDKTAGEDIYYSLSSEAEKELRNRNKKLPLRTYVDQYCDLKYGYLGYVDFENEYVGKNGKGQNVIDKEKLVNLISDFIFQKFRKGIDQIEQIVSLSEHFRINGDDSQKYSNWEKEFINSFLIWDNKDKNQMIYDLIVKSYDFYAMYCSEEIRFDFKGYVFVLDANIIMRLMNINKQYRQNTIRQFIEKAQSIGVKLVVTSFSKDEVLRSIRIQLERIKANLLNDNRISPPEAMRFGAENSYNEDLYCLFYDWYKKNKTTTNPTDKFELFLNKELEKLVDEFCFEERQSYDIKKDSGFAGYVDSLKRLTAKNNNQAETDVNNTLFILEMQKENPNVYLISADWGLIEWGKNIFPSQKGLIELPSLWLSIFMKYAGRITGNDYSVYCQFIRLPIESLQDENLEKRINLRDKVNKTEYADEIKNRMLIDMQKNSSAYLSLSINDATQLAYEKVLSDEYKNGYEKATEYYTKENDNLFKELKNQEGVYLKEKEEHKQQIENIKQEKEKFENLARNRDPQNLITGWVERKVEKKEKLGNFLKMHKSRIELLSVIVFVIITGIMIYIGIEKDKDIIWYLLQILWIIIPITIKCSLKGLIEARERKNLEKKYNKKGEKRFGELLNTKE